MPGKRNPSKQRRQAQRRHERETRAVRTERAKQANRTVATSEAAGDDEAPARRTARPTPGERRPAPAAPRSRLGANLFASRPGDPVGYRAALLAFIFSIAAAISLLFMPVIPKEDSKGKVVENVTLLHYGWRGVMLAAVPVLLTGTVMLTRNSPRKRQSWTISALSLAAYTVLSGSLGLVFIAPTIALGVAAWQVRKAELEAQAAAGGDQPAKPAKPAKPPRAGRTARPRPTSEDED